MSYITRKSETEIARLLDYLPAVAIVGPRQVGKTSLAKHLAKSSARPTVYFFLTRKIPPIQDTRQCTTSNTPCSIPNIFLFASIF
jgi:hypothetical protein